MGQVARGIARAQHVSIQHGTTRARFGRACGTTRHARGACRA